MMKKIVIIILLLALSNTALGKQPTINPVQMKAYKAKADEGDVTLQLEIAQAYNDGILVPKDEKEAIKWYEKVFFESQLDEVFGIGSTRIPSHKVHAAIVEYMILQKKMGKNPAKEDFMTALLYSNESYNNDLSVKKYEQALKLAISAQEKGAPNSVMLRYQIQQKVRIQKIQDYNDRMNVN